MRSSTLDPLVEFGIRAQGGTVDLVREVERVYQSTWKLRNDEEAEDLFVRNLSSHFALTESVFIWYLIHRLSGLA